MVSRTTTGFVLDPAETVTAMRKTIIVLNKVAIPFIADKEMGHFDSPAWA
jgi:hypothetical protein